MTMVTGDFRRLGRRVSTALIILVVCCVVAEDVFAAGEGAWRRRGGETIRLEKGESFQFRVKAEEIPVRSWRLRVQSDHIPFDLYVSHSRSGEHFYFETDQVDHDVLVPWGLTEELSVVITAGSNAGVFDIEMLGPAAEVAPACYSYLVNRALEAYAAGKRIRAEELCREALRENDADGVARVMLAGFLSDRHFYEQAAEMIDEAVELDLPPNMMLMARQLQDELVVLRAPLPKEIRAGLEGAERHLAGDRADEALSICDELLADREIKTEARARILLYRGRSLRDLDRGFEAVDAYTQALASARSRQTEAIIYFRMGELFMDMGNQAQAEGAYSIAMQYGLPVGLEVKAAEALDRIAREKE